MTKLFLIGLVEPVPGREAAFQQWYLDNHVEDSTNDPIFRSGMVFKLAMDRRYGDASAPPQYITFYEVDESDPERAQALHAQYQQNPDAWPPRLPFNDSMRAVGAGWYRIERVFENRSKSAPE